MKTNNLVTILLLSLMAASHGNSADVTVATTGYIEKIARQAAASHPKAEAAKERAEAARMAVMGVRLWQDPELGLGYMAARKEMRQDDGDLMAGFDQMLPRTGLYKAQKRKAEAEHLAQAATMELTSNEIALATAQASLELALADEVISLQAENVAWLDTIVKAAEERAKNPDASGTESLRLEGELAVQRQMLAAAERQRTQFARNLNILSGKGARPDWVKLSLPASPPPLSSADNLRRALERQNPRLASMRYMAQSSQAAADAAKESRKPVFSVGVETSSYSGGDLRSTLFMVKMSLPWFNRKAYAADIVQAEKLREAAERDVAAEQLELLAELTGLVTDAANNAQTADSYDKEVLPKLQQALDTTQSAWVSSKATLLEVLDARRALLSAKQEQKRAIAARHVAYHSISALVGNLTPATGK